MLHDFFDLFSSPWVRLGLLLLLAGVAVYLFWLAPHWWAKRDARDFNADPANDTFHDKFHRQRLTWRAGFGAVLSLVTALPWLWAGWAPYVAAVLAYFVSGGGYFAYCFNHLLSVARNLPYVNENYVSQDPDAANPDAWIWRQVSELLSPWRMGNADYLFQSVYHDGQNTTLGRVLAGGLLRLLCYAILIFSQTLAMMLLVIAIILAAV